MRGDDDLELKQRRNRAEAQLHLGHLHDGALRLRRANHERANVQEGSAPEQARGPQTFAPPDADGTIRRLRYRGRHPRQRVVDKVTTDVMRQTGTREKDAAEPQSVDTHALQDETAPLAPRSGQRLSREPRPIVLRQSGQSGPFRGLLLSLRRLRLGEALKHVKVVRVLRTRGLARRIALFRRLFRPAAAQRFEPPHPAGPPTHRASFAVISAAAPLAPFRLENLGKGAARGASMRALTSTAEGVEGGPRLADTSTQRYASQGLLVGTGWRTGGRV